MVQSASRIKEAEAYTVKRDMYERMKFPTDYYVGIRGIRGIGKTTLLLQLAREYKNPIYLSVDWSYLKPYSLYEIIKYAGKQGFDSFFIDEIHYQQNWASELKTLYDEGYKNIFFTGSSAIGLQKGADISRRAVIFDLPPACFREYLAIKKGIGSKKLQLNELAGKRKEVLAECISSYAMLDEYLNYGGVLYDKKEFDEKFLNALKKIIADDLAYFREIDLNYETNIMKLLYLIATTTSFETNFSKIASALGVQKNTAKRMIEDLEKAGCVKTVFPCKSGYGLVRKEPKIFLPFPFTAFLSRQLFKEPLKGRIREEFFVQHAPVSCYLKTKRGEKTADFMIGKQIFEVGGVSKTTVQNPDFLVTDGVEVTENKIPLFLFGFL
jgi:predicted AAA+ superfamily ATPase